MVFGFVLIEIVAGLFANSLVLLTDAAHNFTAIISLSLGWYSARIRSRPANTKKTYGYHRVGIVVALLNGLALAQIVVYIFYDAIRRLSATNLVQDRILMVVALAAFFVNIATTRLVTRNTKPNLNERSAYSFIPGDSVSTLGTFVTGATIALTGWFWVDPVVSILLGVLNLKDAVDIVREALDILLEGTPADLDADEIVRSMLTVQGVGGVHDLHIWSISEDRAMLTAHILIDDAPCHERAGSCRT